MIDFRCRYPEISAENCGASFSTCEANRKSGVCRVEFVVKTTAREKARIAYCKTIGNGRNISEDENHYCEHTQKGFYSYCDKCEEFIKNYDNDSD